MSGPLPAQERVLPTLNADGSRRRIRPALSSGRLLNRRRAVGWTLIVLFSLIPFLRLHDKPLVLLDIPNREFTLFGRTFFPTDGVLLMLLLLSIFVFIVLTTALVGRAWCGWACPQTVYMELLFRPIERLFEGSRSQQLRLDRTGSSLRRVIKNLVFLVLSAAVANVFLAYFVGVDMLARWMQHSPFEHPTGFIVMAATAGLVFFDFAFFREQMCTVICPYARLQSVLLDKRSLIIGYDARRGEPRSRGKPRAGSGDCIDCGACVRTCPTGIDIRQGLQLECVACGQCVDACNAIMRRINKPEGLIRYSSQQALESERKPRLLRPRVLVYSGLLVVVLSTLVALGSNTATADVTVLRGIGAPFTVQADTIINQIRIKIENRSQNSQRYTIALADDPALELIAPENPLTVAAGKRRTTSVFVEADRSSFEKGVRPLRFRIEDEAGFSVERPYQLLGPGVLGKAAGHGQ